MEKRSGKYTNDFNVPTPMPYPLQFRGPYFVHEGWVPGYPDSHGCVRLRYEDARLLFERMQITLGSSALRREALHRSPLPGKEPGQTWLRAVDIAIRAVSSATCDHHGRRAGELAILPLATPTRVAPCRVRTQSSGH